MSWRYDATQKPPGSCFGISINVQAGQGEEADTNGVGNKSRLTLRCFLDDEFMFISIEIKTGEKNGTGFPYEANPTSLLLKMRPSDCY